MLRTGPVLLRAALLLIAPAAGCARDREREIALLRLFEAGHCTIAGSGGERAAPRASMLEVAGEARPALEVTSADVVTCEVVLPRAPCWLDVAAARRDDAPAALSGAPLLLDVTLVAGTERTTLLHALPSPGTKPTALGWTHARVEISRHLGESVRFEFRLEPPPQESPPPAAPRFALADPQLSPRVDANERPWSVVDWLAPGPSAQELAQADAAKRWPGYARIAAEAADADVIAAPPSRFARPAGELELQAFGCEQPDDGGELERRACDRLARTDPIGPFAPDRDDPALRTLAQLAPATRADRARALGERTIQCELARPRRAPLAVEVTSGRAAVECDAALLRLQEFLVANGLMTRTLFVVRTLPQPGGAGAGGLAILRIPRNSMEQAPTEIGWIVRVARGETRR